MRIFSIIIFVFCLSWNPALAQPEKGTFIQGSIGIGYVYPYEDVDINSSGFYAQGEFVWSPLTWFGVRPYAGMVISSGENIKDGQVTARGKANAFLVGAKLRLVAPIPYVAPFIEGGIGMSAGSFETFTPLINVKESGVFVHVPYTIGLAVGRRHNVEIKFTYYDHDRLEQFSGAAAVSYTLPLNNE